VHKAFVLFTVMGSLRLEALQSISENSCTSNNLNMIDFITIKNPGMYLLIRY